jgi:hypothetical protein
VNTQQAQQQVRQQAQTYQQQHPRSQANAQQREQSFQNALRCSSLPALHFGIEVL